MRVMQITLPEDTLTDLCKEFINIKIAQKCSETTINDYKKHLTKFIDFSNNTIEYKTLENDIITYFARIPDTSPARYNKPYQYVFAFVSWLVDTGKLERNPFKVNKMKKRRDDGNIKPIEINEAKILLDSLDTHLYSEYRDKVMMLIMLDTGIRTSEIRGLHNSDFNPTRGTILITQNNAKTRMERVVFLSANVIKEIKRFISIKPTDWSDWLFPNNVGGQLTETALARDFKKYSDRTGVKCTPYQLRHSYATLSLRAGQDLLSISKTMGHSTVRMTQRYIDLDNKFMREQHSKFSPMNQLNHSTKIVKVK